MRLPSVNFNGKEARILPREGSKCGLIFAMLLEIPVVAGSFGQA